MFEKGFYAREKHDKNVARELNRVTVPRMCADSSAETSNNYFT